MISQDLNGLGAARYRFHRKHGVLLYLRYIDNLLFVCDAHCVPSQLVSELATIGVYKTKLEETGSVGVDFLDFRVVKSEAFLVSGYLQFEPVIRDKGLMLSWTSSHANSVHLSWPVAYIKRLHARSSTCDIFRLAKAKFLSSLRRNYVPEFLLQYFNDCTQYYLPYEQISKTTKYRNKDELYLVLPFHRIWHASSLSTEIRRFSDSHVSLLQEAFEGAIPFELLISWKLPELPFGSTLMKW